MFSKRIVSLLSICFLLCTTVAFAQGQTNKPKNNAKKIAPSIVSDRQVNLYEGTFKSLKQGKEIVKVYFQNIDRKKKIAYVIIQDILFKIKSPKTPLEFKWKDASFSLRWLLPDTKENKDRIQMTSDKPFIDIKYKTSIIHKGLLAQTQITGKQASSLEITDVKKDIKGRMQSFSMKMTPDIKQKNVNVEDKNIATPKVGQQYERSINGMVVYLFAQDLKGQVHLYYR